ECVGPVAYRLKLPQELSCVHDTFHVSNLKKCLAKPDVQVPLDEIEIDENLHFVEEPTEIVERYVKKLKRRRIPLVKVRWNSRQGAEYTWEREDSFKKKYPHLFTNRTSSSTTRTAPIAKSLASNIILNGRSQSRATKIGASVNFFLRVLNASIQSFEKMNGVSFLEDGSSAKRF
nr:reverse transcriptase domain-containing protein [Tanacetum cinerariifolium]